MNLPKFKRERDARYEKRFDFDFGFRALAQQVIFGSLCKKKGATRSNITTCHFTFVFPKPGFGILIKKMIINAQTVILTLLIIAAAFNWGIKFIRNFALQIAQENLAAVTAMDQEEEQQRLKREKNADAAAAAAFAKVEPMLNVGGNKSESGSNV